MKLLKCKKCFGEADIIANEHAINKTIKCRKCGHTNEYQQKDLEIVVIRKKQTL